MYMFIAAAIWAFLAGMYFSDGINGRKSSYFVAGYDLLASILFFYFGYTSL